MDRKLLDFPCLVHKPDIAVGHQHLMLLGFHPGGVILLQLL